MTKQRESIEAKIVWGIGHFFKRLFKGADSADKERIERGKIKEKWLEIENLMKQLGPRNFQSAVIHADKLLDYCLLNLGAKGEIMGERLKNAKHLFRDEASYQSAWQAHKARNALVHEHNSEFLFHQAKETIEQFRKALEGLNIL